MRSGRSGYRPPQPEGLSTACTPHTATASSARCIRDERKCNRTFSSSTVPPIDSEPLEYLAAAHRQTLESLHAMCFDAEWPVSDLAPALEHVIKCTDDNVLRSYLSEPLLQGRSACGKQCAEEEEDLCTLLDIDVSTEELIGACSQATLIETLETGADCIIDDFWSYEQFEDGCCS